MIRFRSFQSRVVFFFLGLLSLVQVVVFLTVDITNTRHAKRQIEVALELGAGTFNRLVGLRSEQLAASLRFVAAELAVDASLKARDRAALHELLGAQAGRIKSDWMLLVDSERQTVADSRKLGAAVQLPELHDLIQAARKSDRAWAFLSQQGTVYQVMVEPVPDQVPTLWLVSGVRVDDSFAQELFQFTKLGVSFFEAGADGRTRILASSLGPADRTALTGSLPLIVAGGDRIVQARVGNEDYLNLVSSIGASGKTPVSVILQRSLEQDLKPLQLLRAAVFLLSCGGLMLSLFGAFYVARSVTRPVRALARAARDVAQGNYGTKLDVGQKDELGELAETFNSMTEGLAERDKVRSLLGKVVSPAIAEKLLSRDLVLGGEEREVTVMFADLRGFTAFCEQRPAQEVVAVLNLYLTRISEIIEAHGGVVDKYLGDGVMALFGAPVSHTDDAGNALRAGLEIHRAIVRMSAQIQAQGMPALDVGVGVHSATVVAGNMGSPDRLNYTVVGDGVNLAARLQTLAREGVYGMGVIASQSTVDMALFRFKVKPLGNVTVKGRAEEVAIVAVIGEG